MLYTHDNDWCLSNPFNRTNISACASISAHLQFAARQNIPVDFARPTEDLSQYWLVIAPSLHLLAEGEMDPSQAHVQNGGTLVGTCSLVPAGGRASHRAGRQLPHNAADIPDSSGGVRHVPPGEGVRTPFRGRRFPPATCTWPASGATSSVYECRVLATYAKDFARPGPP
ncbi:MAG: beta-galactosidase trimerization domain-containing protein [Verrucomicrobiota bacterium]